MPRSSSMHQLKAFSVAVIGAGAMVVAPDVAALPGDTVQFFVAETVTNDSNVFRLSDSTNPVPLIGTSSRSDTRASTSAGVSVDALVSRQRIQAALTVSDERYDRFSDLNFTGRDGRITWLWQAGNDFNGQVGYRDTKASSSFLNIAGTTADTLTTRRAFATGAWRLDANWELAGNLAHQEQRNGAALRQVNDVDIGTGEVGLNYVTAAQNRIGVAFRQENGDTRQLQPITVPGQPPSVDNSYRQRSIGVVADWNMTVKSRLNARADLVRRDFDQVNQRDYSGTTLRVTYELQASEKFAVSAVAQRDISIGEDIQTSFVLVKGLGIRPRWDVTEKLQLSGNVEYNVRDYLGDPLVALGATQARSDHVRVTAGTLSYRPMTALTLGLTAQHESRSSNQARGDYTANILSLFGRFSF